MPYDATLPVNSANVKAAELRGQFAGIKDLIDAQAATISAQAAAIAALGAQVAALNAQVAALQAAAISSVVIDSVTTLPAGQPATASGSISGGVLHISLGLPEGAAGSNGSDGAPGATGADGAPGEVTNAMLAAAIAGTSANSNAVATLGLSVSSTYVPSEVQAIANKMDEHITAERR